MISRNQYSMKFMETLSSGKYPERIPALKDDDLMPFGKYAGKMMKNIPASYLAWLWVEKCNNELVANYIWNNFDAINSELSEERRILR